MYKVKILKGPIFQLIYNETRTSIKTIEYTRLKDLRHKFKQSLIQAKQNNISSIAGFELDINCLLGLKSEKICSLIEGLPYAFKCNKYEFIKERKVERKNTHFLTEMKEPILTKEDFALIPIERKQIKTKIPNRLSLNISQGKKVYKTSFKNTDFIKFGKTIRKTFPKLMKIFNSVIVESKSLEKLNIFLVLPGMLTDSTSSNSENISKKANLKKQDGTKSERNDEFKVNLNGTIKQMKNMFKSMKKDNDTDQFNVLDKPYELSCNEAFEPWYELSCDIFKEASQIKIKKPSSPKKKKSGTLPRFKPHFQDYFVYYLDEENKVRKELVNRSVDTQFNQRIVEKLSNEVFQLYTQRLSTLPCDIFMSSNCVCGHNYHAPRITLALGNNNQILSAVTLCFTTVGFQSGAKDICLLEIECIATKYGFEGKRLASILLIFLRVFAKELEVALEVETAMVAKTSLESEQWWSSRPSFYRSLREVRKHKETDVIDATRWKQWVDESGKRNHQFFNHQESKGQSAFWLSKTDKITLNKPELLKENIRKALSKLVPQSSTVL